MKIVICRACHFSLCTLRLVNIHTAACFLRAHLSFGIFSPEDKTDERIILMHLLLSLSLSRFPVALCRRDATFNNRPARQKERHSELRVPNAAGGISFLPKVYYSALR